MKKNFKKTILLWMIAVSIVVVDVVAVLGNTKTEAAKPVATAFLQQVAEKFKNKGESSGSTGEDIASNMQEKTQNETEEGTLAVTDTMTEATEVVMPEEPETYEFSQVDDSYFDDALFIGDSRAVGMKLYSGLENMQFYCKEGLTVYDMFSEQIVEEGQSKVTVEEALQKNHFGKIYVEIGVNEMGTGNIDSFMEQYEEDIETLRSMQPDAIIFLCGIMCIKKDRSDTDPIFNNDGIRARNERIKELADNKDIFYLEINEAVCDENGDLDPQYTYDDVHLLGKWYSLVVDYMKSHGIVKDSVASENL